MLSGNQEAFWRFFYPGKVFVFTGSTLLQQLLYKFVEITHAQTRCSDNGPVSTYVVSASQTHLRKENGKNCVYTLCPSAVYSVVQSCCSILSHDTFHHCLSSNSSLEDSKRKLGHLFRYCRDCKNTSTIFLLTLLLITLRWDMACMHSSSDPSLISRSGSGSRDQYLLCYTLTDQSTGLQLPTTKLLFT